MSNVKNLLLYELRVTERHVVTNIVCPISYLTLQRIEPAPRICMNLQFYANYHCKQALIDHRLPMKMA